MTETSRLGALLGFGVVTAALLGLGFGTVGGLLALVLLCGLVGAPTAALVGDDLRSRAATVVVAAVLSIAISAIAVQSLVWFELATAELIVLLATIYGAVLARLLSSTGGRAAAGERSSASRW